jgi:hypothetical protein
VKKCGGFWRRKNCGETGSMRKTLKKNPKNPKNFLPSWQAAALPLAGNQNQRASRLSLPADPGCPLPFAEEGEPKLPPPKPAPTFPPFPPLSPLTLFPIAISSTVSSSSSLYNSQSSRLPFFSFSPERPPPSLEEENLEKPLLWGFLIFSFFSLQPGKSPSPSPGQPQPPGPHRSPPADPTDDSSKANHRCHQQERRPPTRHQPRQFLLRSSTIRTATSNGSVEPRRRKH